MPPDKARICIGCRFGVEVNSSWVSFADSEISLAFTITIAKLRDPGPSFSAVPHNEGPFSLVQSIFSPPHLQVPPG